MIWIGLISLSLFIWQYGGEKINNEIDLIRAASFDWVDLTDREASIGSYDLYYLGDKKKNNIDFIMIGDSHLEQYVSYLNNKISTTKNKPKILIIRARGCQPTDKIIPKVGGGEINNIDKKCIESNLKVFKYLENQGFKNNRLNSPRIVYIYCWNCLLKNLLNSENKEIHDSNALFIKEYMNNLINTSLSFTSLDKIFIVLDNPTGYKFSPKYIAQQLKLEKNQIDHFKYIIGDEIELELNSILITQLKKLSVKFIDVRSELCRKIESYEYCLATLNNIPIYRDGDHLTSSFVAKNAFWLSFIFDN